MLEKRKKKIDIKNLSINILIPLCIGAISGFLCMDGMKMYPYLNKSAIAPPAMIFPLVWFVLYILMGISAYVISRSRFFLAHSLFQFAKLSFCLFLACSSACSCLLDDGRILADRTIGGLSSNSLYCVAHFCRISEFYNLCNELAPPKKRKNPAWTSRILFI